MTRGTGAMFGAPLRPGLRVARAAVLLLGAAEACGGRTSVLEADYKTYGGATGSRADSAGGDGAGATFSTGGSGRAGVGGGAATGSGAAVGSGAGGGSDRPTAGGAGSGMAGSGAGDGSGGTASPGGVGGRGGSPAGSGGAGAEAATGGHGSPILEAACERACESQPRSCIGEQSTTCELACGPIASEFPGCQRELTDYLDCLSGVLDPNATCMLTRTGDCLGAGCTTDATDQCAPLLQVFADCQAGCGIMTVLGGMSCVAERTCPGHDYESSCGRSDGDLDYACTCVIDGMEVAEFTVSGSTRNPCADADAQCASLQR